MYYNKNMYNVHVYIYPYIDVHIMYIPGTKTVLLLEQTSERLPCSI